MIDSEHVNGLAEVTSKELCVSGEPPFPCDVPMPRKAKYPTAEGYIYIAQFSTGIIKVGKAVDPKARLWDHEAAARKMGRHITRSWVSVVHSNYGANESALIAYGKAHGILANGAEYFTRIAFKELVEYAETLPCLPLDHEAQQRRREEHDRARLALYLKVNEMDGRALRLPEPKPCGSLSGDLDQTVFASLLNISPEQAGALAEDPEVRQLVDEYMTDFVNSYQNVKFLEEKLALYQQEQDRVLTEGLRTLKKKCKVTTPPIISHGTKIEDISKPPATTGSQSGEPDQGIYPQEAHQEEVRRGVVIDPEHVNDIKEMPVGHAARAAFGHAAESAGLGLTASSFHPLQVEFFSLLVLTVGQNCTERDVSNALHLAGDQVHEDGDSVFISYTDLFILKHTREVNGETVPVPIERFVREAAAALAKLNEFEPGERVLIGRNRETATLAVIVSRGGSERDWFVADQPGGAIREVDFGEIWHGPLAQPTPLRRSDDTPDLAHQEGEPDPWREV